jgi:hypothetical protein
MTGRYRRNEILLSQGENMKVVKRPAHTCGRCRVARPVDEAPVPEPNLPRVGPRTRRLRPTGMSRSPARSRGDGIVWSSLYRENRSNPRGTEDQMANGRPILHLNFPKAPADRAARRADDDTTPARPRAAPPAKPDVNSRAVTLPTSVTNPHPRNQTPLRWPPQVAEPEDHLLPIQRKPHAMTTWPRVWA